VGSFDGIISMIDSYNDKSPHPFLVFLVLFQQVVFWSGKIEKGQNPEESCP